MRLLRWGSEALRRAEELSFLKVVGAYQSLILAKERMGAKSDESSSACRALLDALAVAAKVLKADMAPRLYRREFKKNYRVLFPDEGRQYRMDILEASMERYLAIWVNGEKFEFSPEAICRAKALQSAWSTLVTLLDRCCHSPGQLYLYKWLSRSLVRNIFATLDFAWANFEHQYISELIEIEEKARHALVKAVESEAELRRLEGRHPGMRSCQECCKEQEDLVRWISHLNSLANVRRKGRDDLGVGVLHDALAALRWCDASAEPGRSTAATAAAWVLAGNVVASFNAMRGYLRKVSGFLERVDPQLSNNAGLVDCLADWEASWELGSRYIQNQEVLKSLCDLVAYVQQVQRSVPAFATMFQIFDPEFFMILPRLAWLQFLKAPAQHARLMSSLVPPAPAGDEEFEAFKERFQCTRRGLASLVPPLPGTSAEDVAWELLTKAAVSGFADSVEPCGSAQPPGALPQHGEPERRALEELVRALEPWSIRLQRHCPEDWNQCISIITECLHRADPAMGLERKLSAQTVPFRI